MPKYLRKTNKKANQRNSSAALKRIKRNIYWQAGLALVTIILTIMIVFAMTAAWYTNIVQTSGLVFQAESWGFDGSIVVNDDPILAAPGDEGIIHLEVENENDNIAAVSVNVSKARMAEEEMRKRLFFYVDTQLIQNGETMERVYLTNQDSYTYTVFGDSKLTLTEEIHNDALLKWQWVYDVLGYYVLGERNDEGTNITEIEYLRPIEYDYDDATTTFETAEDGTLLAELKTVDGTTTVEDFLINLSKTDGYKGTIDPGNKLKSGHYPVDVDENGYGVYAYLCNYAEIELATQFDTKLGEAAAAGENAETYEALLTISAQQSDETIITVNTVAALNQALLTGDEVTIQLTNDIATSEDNRLIIPANVQAVLDLNSHTIHNETSQPAIYAAPGSSLTVLNGNIEGTGNNGYGLYSTGAEAILHNVNISECQYGVYLGDSDNNNTLDSKIRLVNSTIDATSCAVFVSGNGTASEQQTQLVVENCKLYSDSIVLSGNGSTSDNGRWGTDIQILNSELISDEDKVGAGIYHPQKDSTLTIYQSKVSGYTGVAIKGGIVSVTNSTITGTGAKQEPGNSGSGFADTGDAIYIETNYGYEILLEVKENSVLHSDHSYGLQVFDPDADNVAVKLYSCVFTEFEQKGDYSGYIAEGSVLNDNNTVTILQ